MITRYILFFHLYAFSRRDTDGFSFFFPQIIIVDANRAYACFQYGHGDIPLGLLQEDEHYDTVTSLEGLFGKSYFCPHCLKGYDHLGEHACPNNKATALPPSNASNAIVSFTASRV